MRAEWQARLKERHPRHRELMLAIRCLTTARDESAVGALLKIVHDAERSLDVRIEAARSAGILVDQGLEADARALTARAKAATMSNRLCGVQLVARHTGDDALTLLNGFAVDAEPAIAAIALSRLIEIDPHLVLPLAEGAIGHADANIRQLEVATCLRARSRRAARRRPGEIVERSASRLAAFGLRLAARIVASRRARRSGSSCRRWHSGWR